MVGTWHLRNLVPLIQALAGQLDRVHVECSHPGQWAEIALLREIPQSMEVIAGIADVKATSEPVLRERIAVLLGVLAPEPLLVSSSCGCGRMPHDHAIELMGNLVRAAHSL
jgi:methionine synthase II (cobalamin-independent)